MGSNQLWILSITSKSSFEVSGKGRCTSSFFRAKQTANFLPGFSLVSLFFSFSLLVLTLLMLECICTHNKQTFSTLYTQWRRRRRRRRKASLLFHSFSSSHSFKETSIMTPIFWQQSKVARIRMKQKSSLKKWIRAKALEPYIFRYDSYTTVSLRYAPSRTEGAKQSTPPTPFFASGKKCILV